jgi:hypothetical protein
MSSFWKIWNKIIYILVSSSQMVSYPLRSLASDCLLHLRGSWGALTCTWSNISYQWEDSELGDPLCCLSRQFRSNNWASVLPWISFAIHQTQLFPAKETFFYPYQIAQRLLFFLTYLPSQRWLSIGLSFIEDLKYRFAVIFKSGYTHRDID